VLLDEEDFGERVTEQKNRPKAVSVISSINTVFCVAYYFHQYA
jgi:hypothetical protein